MIVGLLWSRLRWLIFKLIVWCFSEDVFDPPLLFVREGRSCPPSSSPLPVSFIIIIVVVIIVVGHHRVTRPDHGTQYAELSQCHAVAGLGSHHVLDGAHQDCRDGGWEWVTGSSGHNGGQVGVVSAFNVVFVNIGKIIVTELDPRFAIWER